MVSTRAGGRYQIRYPQTWREELKLACSKALGAKDSPTLKGYICVTDLMDHVVSESKRLFADTKYADSFVLFHDALKQWWEPEAQAYLRDVHGIGPERQLYASCASRATGTRRLQSTTATSSSATPPSSA